MSAVALIFAVGDGPAVDRAYAAPAYTINVRDYAAATGGDDTAGIQSAIDAFLAAERTSGPGRLNFGTGNYLITRPLRFYRLDNTPWFGTVEGDGPEACTIRSSPGFTAATVRNFKYGEFGGCKFSGGPAPSSDLNHAGLVIGDPGLVNGARFHNLTFEHFGLGLGVGDWRTGGAAAELAFDNIGASQNHIGVLAAGNNTLDISFRQLNLAENDVGFWTDSAYGFQFYGGAGTNNGETFHLAKSGEYLISGWREEASTRTTRWISYGGAAAEAHLVIESSNFIDTKGRAFAISIAKLTNAASVEVRGSFINGAVDGKKVTVMNSSFVTRVVADGVPWQVVLNTCWADLSNGTCTGDVPNRITGMT